VKEPQAGPRFVDPVRELGALLLGVEKPARYTGGEYGRLASRDAVLRTLIAFPDLYEIGMSNQALRILYNRMNRVPGISCDRAFAPAPDFERLLRETGTPLYGLDTGISVADLDLFMVTLGYELGIGGVLTMLDVSGVPVHAAGRSAAGREYPVVIAGGPAVSNPLPYSDFIDAFWIGEAEGGGGDFFDLAGELRELKKAGAGREALLARIAGHPNVWVKGKDRALRAVDAGFAGRGGEGDEEKTPNAAAFAETPVFPVPSMKTAQHHGAVEIMRGCPNGCRFCHAGFWYRPMRQKKPETVIAEAEAFISRGGYREISLSSLSSGDYSGLEELVDELNRRFGGRHVSFQMPSLKVSTFSLALLEKISLTRKSGLTFAVETPAAAWQTAINKEVSRDSVVEILREAKQRGWRGAKFYFMIGLPVEAGAPLGADPPLDDKAPGTEAEEIAAFVADIGRRANMRFNINVGIFVPKPHTPYQWAAQIESGRAGAALDFIRSRLRPLGHKVSVSDPLVSLLEGILSRGDERAGRLVEAAWRSGGRLEAWSEYLNKEIWLGVLEQHRDLVRDFVSEKNPELPLPWQDIGAGVSTGYLRKELDNAQKPRYTPGCAEKCANPCGICGTIGGKTVSIVKNSAGKPDADTRLTTASSNPPDAVNRQPVGVNAPHDRDPSVERVLFSFSKTGSAVFHGHLSLVEIFSMAFIRAGLAVQYSRGFNPLAKIEIAAPLSTGVSAGAEIAAADFDAGAAPPDGSFAETLNPFLPEGILVTRAQTSRIPGGGKKHSLSSLLWGFSYAGPDGPEYVAAGREKQFRRERAEEGESLFALRRSSVLAKNVIGLPDREWAPYFDVYRFLYPR
jgi:radical SAM family uncharacterized protein